MGLTDKDEDVYPYKYRRVQGLISHFYHHRLRYSKWLLRKDERDASFWGQIVCTDEAPLTHEVVLSDLRLQHNPNVINE